MKLFKTLLPLALVAAAATSLRAQNFKVLHTFSVLGNNYTNWDGGQPYYSGLTLAGDRLYGMTIYGGASGAGTVFGVSTHGEDFTVLHAFSGAQSPDYTNWDGQYPQGVLSVLGDRLYGTTLNGGTNSGGFGTVFSVGTNGLGFTALHSFTSAADGRNPAGVLAVAGNRLWGMAENGASPDDHGAAFALNIDGTGFNVVHALTNREGTFSISGLTLVNDTLYGAADSGGAFGRGTLFSVRTNGQDFTLLHSFSTMSDSGFAMTNDDGAFPQAALVWSDGRLYGTANFGGACGRGTVFSLATNGLGFQVLHTFTGGWDGAYPVGITVSNGVVYGVTEGGGDADNGTVFSVDTDGSHFSRLYTFSYMGSSTDWTNADGAYPEGAPVLSGNTLYGMTEQGAQGSGTVFSLKLVPSITEVRISGADLVLTGENGVPGESCTVLMSPDLKSPVSQWPPIATNTLTGSGSGFSLRLPNAFDRTLPQRFFTLQVP